MRGGADRATWAGLDDPSRDARTSAADRNLENDAPLPTPPIRRTTTAAVALVARHRQLDQLGRLAAPRQRALGLAALALDLLGTPRCAVALAPPGGPGALSLGALCGRLGAARVPCDEAAPTQGSGRGRSSPAICCRTRMAMFGSGSAACCFFV